MIDIAYLRENRDELAVKNSLLHGGSDFLGSQRFLGEILLHQGLVGARDLLEQRGARLLQLVYDRVDIDQAGAELLEHAGHGALARADSPSQAHHAGHRRSG